MAITAGQSVMKYKSIIRTFFQGAVDLRSNSNSRRTDTGCGTTIPSASWQREALAGAGRIRKRVSLVFAFAQCRRVDSCSCFVILLSVQRDCGSPFFTFNGL